MSLTLFFPRFFSTNGVPNKKRNLSKCPHNAKGSVIIPQFTPWFETRCTVDIDGFYNFRYPLCMGKLSYLKQKDDTPLITISTAEDDETMNGRKAGWTNVYSTLGYGDECSMIYPYVTELSQYPVTCPPCLSRRGNEVELIHYIVTVPTKILFVISEEGRKQVFRDWNER